jgi:tellurite resistance protein TerC
MISGQTAMWIGFGVVVLTIMVVDLGVLQRRSHEVRVREALIMTGLCISLALAFNFVIYLWHGPRPAAEFFGGYLLELSLSVDNLFVFLLIFQYFAVPRFCQHKVLFWGILGALVMRGVFIVLGVVLLQRFRWLISVFGLLLVLTGLRMLFGTKGEIEPERNPVFRLARRHLRVTPAYERDRFFVRVGGALFATPLFLVLIFVETTDLVFAIDSIPAVFGITRDPFIIFTSNVFAILGLRSMFFALSGFMRHFHHLQYGLALILMFIGVKMVLELFHIAIALEIALPVVGAVLAASVLTSLLFPPRVESQADETPEIRP